jgi:4-hydroxy-tetrahydrodipicolinate reductase
MANVAVNGAAGRMGRRVIAVACEEGSHRIVAAIERAGDAHLGEDAGALAGVAPIGVPLTAALPDASGPRIDAVIDFSAPEATLRLVEQCAARRIPVVVATTGHDEKARAALTEAAKTIPLFFAANLSIGVALVTRLVADAARALGLDADIEIVEHHHRKKKDSPSGTALHLARAAAEARGQDLKSAGIYGREGISGGDRPRGEIAIHAVRLGDVVGEHTVTFGFGSERIEISHKAHSRDVFARGALQAARFVAAARPGLYGPADLIALELASKST